MRRTPLAIALAVAAAGLAALALFAPPFGATPVPRPAVKIALVDPYARPLLEEYAELRDALLGGDVEALRAIAMADDSYRAYRAASQLARHAQLEPAERLQHYERELALRIEDPLERPLRRALMLDVAAVAEAAGDVQRAIDAYRDGLPEALAITSLARLIGDPYRLANVYLQARQHRRALEALGGRGAPSIEAPAYRAIGEHGRALDAFRRWLAQEPGSRAAAEGEAWSLFALERYANADTAFAALGGSSGAHGRALIAARQGRIDDAVRFMRASGEPSHLWLASGWLETRGRFAEAIDVYLQIARGGDATYADDAAYRALVLARRVGDPAVAEQAVALVPDGSYFALLLGREAAVPTSSELAPAEPEVLALARALAQVHDFEAARGELMFAMRASDDPSEIVAIAEALQLVHGEFRQSMRAASALIAQGVFDRRVWKLAWPRAYPESVERYAELFDVESALVWSVMRQESAFATVALSHANAMGLMQVIPSTWNWLAELQRENPGDPYEPADNVRYGTYYLRWLLDYFGGDLELVVSSYNRGQGYIRRLFEGEVVRRDKDELYRHIDALETREYLQRVMVNLAIYRQLYDDTAPSEASTPSAPERD
jgi:soluble lytic murein transglycosylase